MNSRYNTFVRLRGWIFLGIVIALSLFVRLRLREMPLERDEGEYAYAGQLMLQGVPPYKLAYNMKLPGTYAAYAVIMAIFGQTPAGIHIGLALVNAASIVLLFLIGRRLLDETTAIVSAVTFGLMSLSPSVLGLAAHATHFVTFFALAGTMALLRTVQGPTSKVQSREGTVQPRIDTDEQGSSPAKKTGTDITEGNERNEGNLRSTPSSSIASAKEDRSRSIFHLPSPIFYAALSGVFFGLAFLMKQHGIFFGIFGFIYLAVVLYFPVFGESTRRSRSRRTGSRSHAPRSTSSTPHSALRTPHLSILHPQPAILVSLFTVSFLLPYALTCLWLWLAGVFPQFWFWTVAYASKYASTVPVSYGADVLKTALDVVIGPYSFFWLLAVAGAVWMWWDARLGDEGLQIGDRKRRSAGLQAMGPRTRIEPRMHTDAHGSSTAKYTNADQDPADQIRNTQHAIRPSSSEALAPEARTAANSLSSIPYLRFFLFAFFLCSFASVSVGFHYRNHYFITLLPVIGLLAGLAVSRAIYLLPRAKTLDLFLALPVPVLLLAAIVWSFAGDGALWFATPVSQAGTAVYKTTAFTGAAEIARYIRESTPSSSPTTSSSKTPSPPVEERAGERRPTGPLRIAVIGSEPEIYFLSHRRSATGYIYTFPLMENQSLAETMQKQMISELETNAADYYIYVNDDLSWLRRPDSLHLIDYWWKGYWEKNLQLVDTITIKEQRVVNVLDKTVGLTPAANPDGSPKCFLVLKRKG